MILFARGDQRGQVASLTMPGNRTDMKWEHKVVKVPVAGTFKPDLKEEAVNKTLAPLGAVGWELVSAFGVHAGNGATIELVLMLKRPAGEEPPEPEGPPPLP